MKKKTRLMTGSLGKAECIRIRLRFDPHPTCSVSERPSQFRELLNRLASFESYFLSIDYHYNFIKG